MKKILAFILSVMMVLSLCACGSVEDTAAPDATPTDVVVEASVEPSGEATDEIVIEDEVVVEDGITEATEVVEEIVEE